MVATCSIEGCGRPYVARGWCGAHYRRWHKYGNPESLAPRRPAPELGAPKECRACNRFLDRGEFPQGWSPCRDCRRERHYSRGNKCRVCAMPLANSSRTGLCRDHLGEQRRTKNVAVKRRRVTGGYIVLTGYADHPNARSRGTILEHVKVMSDVLGRPLFDGENVHHLNGVRDDNRPENLELWVVKQPQGQRPADLVVWAREILERYDQGERVA